VRARLPEALERLKPYFEVTPPGGGGDGEAERDHPDGTGLGPGEVGGSTRLDL